MISLFVVAFLKECSCGQEVSTAAVKKQLADKIYDLNLKMFLRDNSVHGDMHVRTRTHERCLESGRHRCGPGS